MSTILLTDNEQRVLYGILRCPQLNDSELSGKIKVKLSTLTTVKKKLYNHKVFKKVLVPLLNRLGSELLTVIYTQFNPVIPFEERVSITKDTIEVFDEIFFSVGEQEKGFSISMAKNYSSISRIEDIRIETFGSLGLLEKKYPTEVIFPFETSEIIHFFDFSRVIKSMLDITDHEVTDMDVSYFKKDEVYSLSSKEKLVYTALVRYPTDTVLQISQKIGLSRHTISLMKKKFIDLRLVKYITVPDLGQLGFEILVFYHYQFNPCKVPIMKDILYLDNDSTIFFARRKYEVILISAYRNYQDYKEDKMNKICYLKENDFIANNPLIREYMFGRMVVLKDFIFHPITKNILG